MVIVIFGSSWLPRALSCMTGGINEWSLHWKVLLVRIIGMEERLAVVYSGESRLCELLRQILQRIAIILKQHKDRALNYSLKLRLKCAQQHSFMLWSFSRGAEFSLMGSFLPSLFHIPPMNASNNTQQNSVETYKSSLFVFCTSAQQISWLKRDYRGVEVCTKRMEIRKMVVKADDGGSAGHELWDEMLKGSDSGLQWLFILIPGSPNFIISGKVAWSFSWDSMGFTSVVCFNITWNYGSSLLCKSAVYKTIAATLMRRTSWNLASASMSSVISILVYVPGPVEIFSGRTTSTSFTEVFVSIFLIVLSGEVKICSQVFEQLMVNLWVTVNCLATGKLLGTKHLMKKGNLGSEEKMWEFVNMLDIALVVGDRRTELSGDYGLREFILVATNAAQLKASLRLTAESLFCGRSLEAKDVRSWSTQEYGATTIRIPDMPRLVGHLRWKFKLPYTGLWDMAAVEGCFRLTRMGFFLYISKLTFVLYGRPSIPEEEVKARAHSVGDEGTFPRLNGTCTFMGSITLEVSCKEKIARNNVAGGVVASPHQAASGKASVTVSKKYNQVWWLMCIIQMSGLDFFGDLDIKAYREYLPCRNGDEAASLQIHEFHQRSSFHILEDKDNSKEWGLS